MDGITGDAWSASGDASVDLRFFGDGNPGHGTLFGDNIGSAGAVFQPGIPASGGLAYEATFHLQWESDWDARTRYGLEFYAQDDATKLGETIIEITEDTAYAGTGYRRYDVVADAPPDAAFVRPVVLVDAAQSPGASRAMTVDNVLVREADEVLALNPGFGDVIGDGLAPADFWTASGDASTGLDDAPNGNPGHATLLAGGAGNSGEVFQTGIPAIAGRAYALTVDIAFETGWDAEASIAIEFYGADDSLRIGLAETEITGTPGAGYSTYRLEGVAPASLTRFARPVLRFQNATGGAEQADAVADNAVLRLAATGCTQADVAPPYGVLDLTDINAFVAGFSGQMPVADIDGNGLYDLNDINVFLASFIGGCQPAPARRPDPRLGHRSPQQK